MQRVPLPDLRGTTPGAIEVHRVDLALDREPVEALMQLDAAEREQVGRFARCADRVRFAATRAAVRGLLARRLGCAPTQVRFSHNRHGKPYVADLPGLPFNVTHAGAHALIAIGDGSCIDALGIDIECCQRTGDAMSILDVAFTACEQARIRAAADPLAALYRHWTAKEAALKAVGVGVAEHLHLLTVDPEHHQNIVVSSRLAGWTSLQAMALAMPGGYVAALAWRLKEHSCKTS